MDLKLHCFFCGAQLRGTSDAVRWLCLQCGGAFSAERDSEGCVIRMQVQGCGAEECCQHSPDDRSS